VDTLITILTDPKFLTIVGPLGVAAALEAWAIYSLFTRLEDLQEKRLQDWQTMKDEYTQLSSDINKTLDVLIKTLGRKNGNGNGGCNG
jgi:hypothetical protein